MMANINLPRIVDVKLWNCDFGSDAITSLLSCTPNINSLRFSFNLLTSKQTAIIINCDGLKRLDISGDRHTFTEEDVSTFARLFPHVEHLEINTISLYKLPLLNVYLPHLRSLTFKIIDNLCAQSNDNEEQRWENEIRQSTQFLFKRTSDWITIWIDQNTFNETYWQTFQQQVQSDESPNDSENLRKKHKSYSFESQQQQQYP
jgi:hypothetical protein